MSEAEDRLYGLMEIADRQQAAVQTALDGLAAERCRWRRGIRLRWMTMRLYEPGCAPRVCGSAWKFGIG
jgi:hypothetical protein